MKFSSSIRFDSLIMPIFFIFFYDHRSASGSISGPEIAHSVICTGASGDLYWRQFLAQYLHSTNTYTLLEMMGCTVDGAIDP